MDLAQGEYYEENNSIIGMRFDAQQSISGLGIASSYRCIQTDPLMLKSQSSGSGYYSSNSVIIGKKDVDISGTDDEYKSSGREVKFKENMSSAYLPTTTAAIGSFVTGPTKYKWSDITSEGNIGGVGMKISFSEADSLVKEISAEISGKQTIDRIHESSGSFKAGMELNSAFNGTAQVSAIYKDQNETVPVAMLDEYYRGAFSLVKKMKISEKSTESGADEDELLELPCCFGGIIDISSSDMEGLSAECVFNCSLPR
jgi:hypothetical protein